MNTKRLLGLVICSLLAVNHAGFAQEKPAQKAAPPTASGAEAVAPKSPAAMEILEVTKKIQAKVTEFRKAQSEKVKANPEAKSDKITEADLTAELKGYDAILEKYKGDVSDDVAQALSMKSMVYIQLLGDYEKGITLTEQLKKDFPNSKQAKAADKMIESLKNQMASAKIRENLVEGAKFPDFAVKDVNGKPLSIANYKGKVVLIDFWATWCPPCVKDMPSVLEVYKKYHDKGFEIIGISLDSDKAKLDKFVADNQMPWQQFFDGQGWKNELSTKYGVNSIPATYLLDGEGKVLGKGDDIRGDKLEGAVAKALGKS